MDVNLLYAEQDKYVPSQEAGDSEGDNGKQVSFAIGYKINHLCGLRIWLKWRWRLQSCHPH